MVAKGARIITLTTDFGAQDWFVGTMKGVVLGINPTATLVDLNHEILAGDLPAGAFALAAAYRFFPTGTVHVAVVDPGVGSSRKALAVKTENYFFVGPDNGVLSWALREEKLIAIHSLENEAFFRRPVSRTFHGRDVFAPAAAHISNGTPLSALGPELKNLIRLPWPEPRRSENQVVGQVLYLDRFGNAITNLSPREELATESRLEVFQNSKRLCGVAEFYGAVRPGKPVAVFGSTGFLEIAINGGSAAQKLRLRPGSEIALRKIPR